MGGNKKGGNMITLTIFEKVKVGNRLTTQRRLAMYSSLDKLKKDIVPIIQEMNKATKEKREPNKAIVGVSYDSESERKLLVDVGALKTTEDTEF